MNITVNGETREVSGDTTVLELVESLGFSATTVVVQQNDAIISRDAYAATPLRDGDVLELIRFVGGG